ADQLYSGAVAAPLGEAEIRALLNDLADDRIRLLQEMDSKELTFRLLERLEEKHLRDLTTWELKTRLAFPEGTFSSTTTGTTTGKMPKSLTPNKGNQANKALSAEDLRWAEISGSKDSKKLPIKVGDKRATGPVVRFDQPVAPGGGAPAFNFYMGYYGNPY